MCLCPSAYGKSTISQCPHDNKKQMKKYGAQVPLAAFVQQSLFQKFSSDQAAII